MKKRRILCFVAAGIFCVALPTAPSFSQERLIDRLVEQSEEFSDQSAALDYLENLAEHPVPVNSATFEEFMFIPGISPAQARRIIHARDIHRRFSSLESVRIAGGLSESLFRLIAPLLSLSERKYRVDVNIRQRNQRKGEKSRGYTSGAFQGSILRNYSRLRFRLHDTAEAGILLEKDPGEDNLADHRTGFIRLGTGGRAELVAGSFSLEFAQGLLFSRRAYFGKSRDPVAPLLRRERGGRGYLSSSESEGFFGLYHNLRFGAFNLSLFTADTNRDARIGDDGAVTSFALSGLHRTVTERSHENTVNERLIGARVRIIPGTGISLGLTKASVRYTPGMADNERKRLLSEFSGDELTITGIDAVISWNDIEWFGEAGISNPGSRGFVGGFTWSGENTRTGVLYRNYAGDFYSPFGHSFADRTTGVRNERGFYAGLSQKISGRMSLSTYVDIFEHPRGSFSIPVQENGKEVFLQFSADIDRSHKVYVNWRRKEGLSAAKREDEFGIARKFYENEVTDRLRIQGDFQLAARVRMIPRVEIQTARRSGEHTRLLNAFVKNPVLLFSTRMNCEFPGNVRVSVQTVFFSTHGSHIYQYEPDLPGLLTVKQYTGQGERIALLFRRRWGPGAISIKYGMIHLPGQSSIGSGFTEIERNYSQEFGIQWDMNYKELRVFY